MRRLHWKFYLAIVGTLMMFLVASMMVWHALNSPIGAAWGIESATQLSAKLLDNGARAAPDTVIVDGLAYQLNADVVLVKPGGALQLAAYSSNFRFGHAPLTEPGWHLGPDPTYGTQLQDGRLLVVHPHHRLLLHGLHLALILCGVAGLLALLIYPVTRHITARLARLEQGVRQFGAGNLAARVAVEGRDEVATLATSFNESAARIERLVRAHQMLLANCSHELRTPLTRMRLATERLPADTTRVELVDNIAELDALIGELLLTSRLDVARKPDRVEAVDLLALAAEEAAHFDCEVAGEPAMVNGDPLLLRRLVRNLLENARLHGGGATDVRVSSDDGGARILVEDAGPGVPPEDRDQIFEPFHRARGATSQGVGLGLAIVRQIARVHGGDVVYEPRDGGGSRFIVSLQVRPIPPE
jgi:signal transduction histidine kinase